MKVKSIIVFLFLATGLSFAQTYPLVSLHDINFVGDTVHNSWPNSPKAGDTVRVQGLVMVRPIVGPTGDRRPILWFNKNWGCYIQAADGSDWSGLNVFQADTTIQATFFDLVDTAQVVEFTGVVTPYGAQTTPSTELALITSPQPIPVSPLSSLPKRLDPIPLTLDSFWTASGGFNYDMRKYLGQYVVLNSDDTHPLISSDVVTGTTSTAGNFKINDLNGHYATMYAQSSYFKTSNLTLRPGYAPPAAGSYFKYIRGILESYNNVWEIVPMYPEDLGPTLQSPPAISLVTRDISVVTPNDQVNVTCSIKAVTAGTYVKGAALFIRLNGQTLDSLDMTKVTPLTVDSLWTVTIPQINIDSAYVEFYIKAYGSNNLNSNSPQNLNTSRFSYFILNRPLTIQDVRYSPLGSGYSSYNGYKVTISGVVTSDTSDIPGNHGINPSKVFIQNGTGPWSGILIGTAGPVGTTVASLKHGDNVTVTGMIAMNATFAGTRIDTLDQIILNSQGNPIPEPHVMATGDVGTSLFGTLNKAECWNGTLVKYENVTIDSANADGAYNYGESFCKDSSGGTHTRLIWSDGNTFLNAGAAAVSVTKGDSIASITGVLMFTHSNYKLCARKNDDIIGYKKFVPVEGIKNESQLPTTYTLNQNYPNPFNPSTTISYSIPKTGMVTIKIYNVLGQAVKTLVNQVQNPGNFHVTFNANSLTSGVYFYSIKADNFTQVKKMMLLK
jgi:hypothetical protein